MKKHSLPTDTDLSDSTIVQMRRMRRSLLTWYAHHGRNLPWRYQRDPYLIWVSEIMLQQTQVKTVIPYYHRWFAQFPTLQHLAAADLQQVLKTWEGLGYYSRARNLHKAAQQLIQQHNGSFPDQLDLVLALPGIGRTTAGGILSAAFNLPVPILDGNVKQVLARLVALPVPPAKSTSLWQLSETLLDPIQPRDFNQAINGFGGNNLYPKKSKMRHLPLDIPLSSVQSRYPIPNPHA